jgi:hypothetical protein
MEITRTIAGLGFVLRQFLQTRPNRARGQTGCRRHRGDATITRGERLRRRDQTPAAFVEKRRYRGEPSSDGYGVEQRL